MTKHLQTALTRIRRSPYQTLAAVSIMTMTLFVASVFSIIAAGSQVVLKHFETRPQVNAYYKTDYQPKQEEIDALMTTLEQTGQVESAKYISKDDALKTYRELNASEPLLLEAVTAAMLPASFEVSALEPGYLKPLADLLKTQPNIDDVRFAEDIVSSLTRWTNSIRLVGMVIVGIYLLITLVIILLIIGIKVANRRDEIHLLQLIGASRGYISAPFVWEGIIYGLVGAVISWMATVILLLYSTPFLVNFLSGIPIRPLAVPFLLSVLAGEMVLGILVGSFGGAIAVRRFLKS